MMENQTLDHSPLHFTIRQMYDYLKIGFAHGFPYDSNFEIDISVEDAKNIIKLLQKGKNELKRELTLQEKSK